MRRARARGLLRRVRGRRGAAQERPDPLRATSSEADWAIIEEAQGRSMTGVERLQALVDSVRYLVERGIEGDLVECGVWLGGSVLCMIRTLQDMGVHDRDIWLYDTFEGMTKPTELDTSKFAPESALESWNRAEGEGETLWPFWFDEETFSEERVRQLLDATGYPPARLHFVRGRVEETIPGAAPEDIALLRLDTDWYESTRHELEHLYPRLARGGVLILDDYGFWDGARRAVDEYFAARQRVLMTRVDPACRLVVKP